MTKPLATLLVAIIPSNTCDLVPGSKVRVRISAYCPCKKCCGTWASRGVWNRDRKTATGTSPFCGGCAIDPRAIPYGSRLVFSDGTELIADDTGGAIRRAWGESREIWIDIRCQSHEEAVQRGVYWSEVEVR